MKRFPRLATATLFLSLLAALPARAVIVIGDLNNPATDPGRNTGPEPNGLDAYVGQFGSFLGTPIAPQYFVTANHIHDAGGGIFTFNNNTGTTTTYHVALAGVQEDLAVWKITDPGLTFSYFAPLYLAGNEVGRSVVTLGRGTQRGSPVGGSASSVQGWNWGAGDSLTSWGTNVVTRIINGSSFNPPNLGGGFGGDFLYFTFDASRGPNTGIYSGGDSGGPTFVLDTDGIYKLAGINSLVDQVQNQAGTFLQDALFDARGYYDGGMLISDPNPVPLGSYATRIDDHLDFITGFAPVPEPTSLVLTGLGALALAGHCWRKWRCPGAGV